ncbi:hypothetical protein CDO73_19385 [Saccharibacillus sp. O23]|uniref:hypothetical protein n=1 Tax=Saccharibacillus sp. O23 TaxID=2009338 RepID=UPI000B4E31CB|nr:hypothetical protein [Saccharibacillus sp. O23]OWR28052.1 hypothetical protein CDO73_19385 [Saccharibacillus sp. O23]
MDNRFPPSGGPDGRPNGPDLRKDPERDERSIGSSEDPYRSEDGRSYEERMNPPFSPVDGPSPYDEYPRDDRRFGPLKHSGLGIASFVLALIGILLFIVCIVAIIGTVASMVDSTGQVANIESLENGNLLMAIGFAGFGILGAAILNLIGLILGIIGLVVKDRKKVFAIIGTILNGLCVLTGGGFILISTVMGAAGGM